MLLLAFGFTQQLWYKQCKYC